MFESGAVWSKLKMYVISVDFLLRYPLVCFLIKGFLAPTRPVGKRFLILPERKRIWADYLKWTRVRQDMVYAWDVQVSSLCAALSYSLLLHWKPVLSTGYDSFMCYYLKCALAGNQPFPFPISPSQNTREHGQCMEVFIIKYRLKITKSSVFEHF